MNGERLYREHAAGASIPELAARYKRPASTVYYHIKKFQDANKIPRKRNQQYLQLEKLYRSGKTIRELTAHYGVCESTIYKALRRREIPLRPVLHPKTRPRNPRYDEYYERFIAGEITCARIAREMGNTVGSVNTAMRLRFGGPIHARNLQIKRQLLETLTEEPEPVAVIVKRLPHLRPRQISGCLRYLALTGIVARIGAGRPYRYRQFTHDEMLSM